MTLALFGKTQAKRDFVAPGAPRGFLDAWEPWMQAGLSASRHALGETWRESYLTAPLWRFWLGGEICGATIRGAFMSSLDGVGRFYPFAALAVAPTGAAIPSPDLDPLDEWHRGCEDFLLGTLEERSWERILAAAQALPDPPFWPPTIARGEATILPGGALAAPISEGAASAFASLAAADWAGAQARHSCFWTEGGEGFPATAIRSLGLPAPEIFARFLAGALLDDPEPGTARDG
jgi:type VI secretion system protein ImpM